VISIVASCFLALMVWLLQVEWLIRFAEWLQSVVPAIILFIPFILFVAWMVVGPVFVLAGCFTWLSRRSLIPVVIGQLAIVGLWIKFDWWLLHDLLAAMAAAGIILQFQFRASFLRLSLVLLVAAFLYDAIQVFGTGNMSAYAEAVMPVQETAHQARVYGFPALFVIPEGFAQHATWVGMLGMGDVIVGGLMAVTALRVGRRVGTYAPFYAVVGAYAASLLCADLVIRQFHVAQPATIYIVPLCMGSVMIWAGLSGHWSELKKPAFGKELYAPDQQ
jgi:presenilin-like A22 family membrane protease